MKECFGDCCNRLLIVDSGAGNPDFLFVQILSRGGLTIPLKNLVNYVCTAFAFLEFVYGLITKSGLPVRKAAAGVLIHCFQSCETFVCTTHETIARKITNSTAINIFINNKRKIFTDSVATNGVKTFKKRQREKSSYSDLLFLFLF